VNDDGTGLEDHSAAPTEHELPAVKADDSSGDKTKDLIDTLAQIVYELGNATDRQSLSKSIMKQISRVINADVCGIYLTVPDSNEIQLTGIRGVQAEDEQIPLGHLAAGHITTVVKSNAPFVLHDATSQTTKNHWQLAPGEKIGSQLYVPIFAATRSVGVVACESLAANAFDESQVSKVIFVCRAAAVSFTNSILLVEDFSREMKTLTNRVVDRTAKLERANAELERASGLKDEFLANMSHELRTPMNAVIGLTEAILEGTYGDMTEGQRKSLHTILQSGRHLLSLINDILDLAKIQAGKVEPVIGPVSAAAICRSSIQLIREQSNQKHQKLIVDTISNDIYVMADERHLKQVLVNLLSNAVKFTPPNGRLGVTVKSFEQDKKVVICVWDEGVGISPDDQEQIFRPFQQLDSGLSRWQEGTGLGLSLVKRLTELGGGRIEVTSNPGQGSRFSVTLPLSEVKAVDRKASRPDLRVIRVSSNEYRVLLAEDNAQNVDLLKSYLNARGYKVSVARDGRQALEMATAGDYHVILMDIQMPLMDGLEVTRRVKADPRRSHVPIIGLTALAMPGDRQRCLDAGCDAYLSKPVSLRALLETMERLIANHGDSSLTRDTNR
jgi:signal transduction histidine kinase/AmiR/NasT family two-component response regulator